MAPPSASVRSVMRRDGLASAARRSRSAMTGAPPSSVAPAAFKRSSEDDGLEAVLEHERRVPVGEQVHLGDAGAAHGRAHEEEDVVLVGCRDAGHVVRSRRHRVEGVHDTLRTARRAGREEDHAAARRGRAPSSERPRDDGRRASASSSARGRSPMSAARRSCSEDGTTTRAASPSISSARRTSDGPQRRSRTTTVAGTRSKAW